MFSRDESVELPKPPAKPGENATGMEEFRRLCERFLWIAAVVLERY